MRLAQFLHGASDARTDGALIGNGHNYELISGLAFGGRRRRVFGRLAEISGAGPGDLVLDVGCGTGYFTRLLAQAVGPAGRATGLDPSAEVIAHARALTEIGNCTFVDGIAERIEAAEHSYDVVVTTLMIHHLPEPARLGAVREMYRVLRPGGRLLLADFRPPSSRVGRHLIGALTGPAMSRNPVDRLAVLAREAGFGQLEQGRVRPWLQYVLAVRPM